MTFLWTFISRALILSTMRFLSAGPMGCSEFEATVLIDSSPSSPRGFFRVVSDILLYLRFLSSFFGGAIMAFLGMISVLLAKSFYFFLSSGTSVDLFNLLLLPLAVGVSALEVMDFSFLAAGVSFLGLVGLQVWKCSSSSYSSQIIPLDCPYLWQLRFLWPAMVCSCRLSRSSSSRPGTDEPVRLRAGLFLRNSLQLDDEFTLFIRLQYESVITTEQFQLGLDRKQVVVLQFDLLLGLMGRVLELLLQPLCLGVVPAHQGDQCSHILLLLYTVYFVIDGLCFANSRLSATPSLLQIIWFGLDRRHGLFLRLFYLSFLYFLADVLLNVSAVSLAFYLRVFLYIFVVLGQIASFVGACLQQAYGADAACPGRPSFSRR